MRHLGFFFIHHLDATYVSALIGALAVVHGSNAQHKTARHLDASDVVLVEADRCGRRPWQESLKRGEKKVLLCGSNQGTVIYRQGIEGESCNATDFLVPYSSCLSNIQGLKMLA